MMKILILPFLLFSSAALAQTSPLTSEPASPKPVLIRVDPAPAMPVMDGNVRRLGLMQVCATALEGQALNSVPYKRGKDVVPEEAAQYRRDVTDYIAFACPCVVDTLDKEFGLSTATPEKLAIIGQKIGSVLQQSCSKDVYIAQRKD